MASWNHFLPENHFTVSENKQTPSNSNTSSNQPQQHHENCFRSSSPSTVKTSSSSISAVLPEKYDPSLGILRSLSSDSAMQEINKNEPLGPDYDGSFRAGSDTAVETSQIPRRNLTEAFEELYVKPSGSELNKNETPLVKQATNRIKGQQDDGGISNMISPTGVMDLGPPSPSAPSLNLVTPSKDEVVGKLDDKLGFSLHPKLKRDLTDALVQRISFYAVIHDINKEATSMAANDDSGYNRKAEEISEENDPLIAAVQGKPKNMISGTSSMVHMALIDEEVWLLDTINARGPEEARAVKACPPTFSQAMGERDYESPLYSLSNGSRTQLWKPSRSWWEAKSGKNPWIEPKSHNKRWRYLWPLIHYHKFLAKCIKKLKRNDVDVKISVSPVAVFLREEVCAVSDHLAAVSLFDSDEWMLCLLHFKGWIESNTSSESRSRLIVSKLKLRSLSEPGDVDSPLLRSQIDEQYLQAMATARLQLAGTEHGQEGKRSKDPLRRKDGHSKVHNTSQTPKLGESSSKSQSQGMPLRHWQGYGHPGWWQNGWHPAGYPYADDASVQSALSGDTSFSHGYMNAYHPSSVHPHHQYYHPMMYHQHMIPAAQHPPYDFAGDASMYSSPDLYNAHHMTHGGWMRHPMGYSLNSHVPESPAIPSTPSRTVQGDDVDPHQEVEDRFDPNITPHKYSPSHAAMSPYWAHLHDHATLSMMGLATPQGPSAVPTPHLGGSSALGSEEGSEEDDLKVTSNVQPLLLRQQYYGYGQYNLPSPASQFLMTPNEQQANTGYAYSYGSPRRSSSHRNVTNSINEEVNDARNDVSELSSENTTPLHPPSKQSRESPNQTQGIVAE